jgi:hypothetical protein
MKSSVRSLNYSKMTEGECKGFFRIPQVAQFVTYARTFTESQISQLSESIERLEQLAGLLPIYEEAGEILTKKSESNVLESNVLESNSKLTHKQLPLPLPEFNSRPTSKGTASTEPHDPQNVDDQVSVSIQELGRFVTVSAMLGYFPDELKSHEREYNTLISRHRETYSVFREGNPTYQLIQSKLCKRDPRYLAKLMLWRVYL